MVQGCVMSEFAMRGCEKTYDTKVYDKKAYDEEWCDEKRCDEEWCDEKRCCVTCSRIAVHFRFSFLIIGRIFTENQPDEHSIYLVQYQIIEGTYQLR